MKLTLRPNARAKLRELRQRANAVAQQPVARMTEDETRAFLDNAPVMALDITPEFAARMEQATHDIEAGHTIPLSGMSDEAVMAHWARTLRPYGDRP